MYPSEGRLEAYVNHVAKNKALIKITFTARYEYNVCIMMLVFQWFFSKRILVDALPTPL